MGKRGRKAQFLDVACPNEACDLYGVAGQGNVVGNRTYVSRGKKQENTFAVIAAKHFVIIQVVFIMIFAKMNKLLI